MTALPTTSATEVRADGARRDTALERLDRLETLLGDPYDPANPLGEAAVLGADERGELPADGERALAAYGLGAEFAPAALGGRFERADRFALLMRAIFRRDCSLGIGHGVTSFIAGLPIWSDGSPEQQQRAADLLCGGGRIVAAYTELDHGSDFTRISLAAGPAADGGYLLDGGKQLVNNIGRAEAAVLFARTDERPGSRGHSHLLVDLDALPAGHVDRTARYPTSGGRGCLLGGARFDSCPVPAAALLGEEGGAMETVLKVFQVTRCVLPGMVVGVGDSQLRTVLAFAGERQLYGAPVSALPLPRSVLTDAFVDLLICDALSMVAARTLHLRPAEASVRAAAVKYLVPKLLQENSYRLGVVLGARSYLREGPYAAFQKAARDLPVVALAHASGAVCLANIVPQLPRLAERAWQPALDARTSGPDGDEALFRLHDPLPSLDFGRLELTTRGADGLAGRLPLFARDLARQAATRPELAELAGLAGEFSDTLADLARRSAALPPLERTPVAGRRSFLLAERYVLLLAAAACLGVWRTARRSDGFLADPLWVTAALHRLAGRLGPRRGPLPQAAAGALFDELSARHDDARTFDLFRTRLALRAVPVKGVAP
ncbi:acyl-CoA dehydrogenase [Streptomyces spongiicola]|uniref:Acyl-CoA dehydrogenase n=1 Tax=Streptomyces spongiicola TaxID=1690221 RepID=A0ABM6V7Y5_9ACTN|nr:acyl-CoA dehydrogenase family protein [Streptomyces spongiicola]AWK10171.1 acyl-CoA dehydrogenase [Streptomyces spongiicola]